MTTTLTLEQIRTQAAEAMVMRIKTIAEQAEIRQLTNVALQDSIATQTFKDMQLGKLKGLIATFRSYYEVIPTRTQEGVLRKAPTVRLFGQGEQLDLLSQLMALVTYAPAAHKLLIETQVTVSSTLAEAFLSSLGRTAHINREGATVDEVPADFAIAKTSADLLFVQLDVLLTTDTMNETRLLESFIKAANAVITTTAKKATMDSEEEVASLFTM